MRKVSHIERVFKNEVSHHFTSRFCKDKLYFLTNNVNKIKIKSLKCNLKVHRILKL